MNILTVGDEVNWRGGFGNDSPKTAVVKNIELCEQKRSKSGIPVKSVSWDKKDYIVVSLSNGHWAYGYQIFKK